MRQATPGSFKKGSVPWNKGKPGKRPKGLVYMKHKENPTSFQPGFTPWNSGLAGTGRCKPNAGSIKPGQRKSLETEFTSERSLGKSNFKWKGDAVGYNGLHTWVQRTLGKAKLQMCQHCRKANAREWANKTHAYLRSTEDWIALCAKCHDAYDRATAWGVIKDRFALKTF